MRSKCILEDAKIYTFVRSQEAKIREYVKQLIKY